MSGRILGILGNDTDSVLMPDGRRGIWENWGIQQLVWFRKWMLTWVTSPGWSFPLWSEILVVELLRNIHLEVLLPSVTPKSQDVDYGRYVQDVWAWPDAVRFVIWKPLIIWSIATWDGRFLQWLGDVSVDISPSSGSSTSIIWRRTGSRAVRMTAWSCQSGHGQSWQRFWRWEIQILKKCTCIFSFQGRVFINFQFLRFTLFFFANLEVFQIWGLLTVFSPMVLNSSLQSGIQNSGSARSHWLPNCARKNSTTAGSAP